MSEIANTIFSPELAARFDHLVTIYPLRRSALAEERAAGWTAAMLPASRH